MGGSAGNAKNLKDLFAEFDPMAIRFLIIQSHYRSPLDFDLESLTAARTGLDRIRKTITRLREAIDGGGIMNGDPRSGARPAFMEEFLAAMDDDFNTPLAIGALSAGIGEVNQMLASSDPDRATLISYADALETAYDRILGLNLFAEDPATDDGALTGDLVELLIELRKEARGRKDFASADAIRDRLKSIGIALEDGKEGTRWEKV